MHLLDRTLFPRFETARGAGHVESWFAMLQAPDGQRAVWLKQTVLVRAQGPAEAASWAILFDEGRGERPRARRLRCRLGEIESRYSPFRLATPGATMQRRDDALTCSGRLEGHGAPWSWDVTVHPLAPPTRPLAARWLHEAPFPRNKTLAPVPIGRGEGHFDLGGDRWRLDGWRAHVGHNWGPSHPHRYVWITGAGEAEDGRPLHFEFVAARLRLGGRSLPWLGAGYVSVEGRRVDVGLPRSLRPARVTFEARTVGLTLYAGRDRIETCVRLDRDRMALLPYENPDGSTSWCLNSKLAWGHLTWRHGRRTRLRFAGHPIAVEIGLPERPEAPVPSLES